MFGNVPGDVLTVLDSLKRAGFEAYLVGGCVRDFLMGREPKDYDINTSALPEDVHRIFGQDTCVDTGLQHGTVTVVLSGMPIEVTTFRSDGDYSDSRHPDSVTLGVPLTEDLRRRDFTINAMCWSPEGGIKDFFDGRGDLEKRVIRCVGDPRQRFREDALRILRAVRFASVIEGTIEPETERAMIELLPTLDRVAPERKAVELSKLLCGEGAGRVLMLYPEVIDRVVPGILRMKGYDQNNPYHRYTLLEHTAGVLDAAPPTREERLAALLHDIAKPLCRTTDEKGVSHYKGHPLRGEEIARKTLTELRFDNKTIDTVCVLVRNHDNAVRGLSDGGVRRMLARVGSDNFFRLIDLMKADNKAKDLSYWDNTPAILNVEERGRRMLAEGQCLSLGQLAINGRDLEALGFKSGPDMGRELKKLLDLVIEDPALNTRETLMDLAGRDIGETTGPGTERKREG